MSDHQSVIRKGPVGWFSLRLLIRSGLKAVVTRFVGPRTARREVLAALSPGAGAVAAEAGPDGAVWVDYVADCGDSFDATYSVAWRIGRDHLFLGAAGEAVDQPVPRDSISEVPLSDAPEGKTALPAGRTLIFGGDQVYPYSIDTEYEDRCTGPYFAARPWDESGAAGQGRKLLALPGNHDWYDGLAGFVRLFCQNGRWHGGWQVAQSRSYFSVHLGSGFWLWGFDFATDDEIDAPQLAYFDAQARNLAPGDKVVFCLAKPAWVERGQMGAPSPEDASRSVWHKTRVIEDRIRKATSGKARVAMFLSGDLHHYSRYVCGSGEDRQEFITCGGGGAYLLGTEDLDDYADLSDLDGSRPRGAAFRQAYPDRETSAGMRKGLWRFPRNFLPLNRALSLVMLLAVSPLDYVLKEKTGADGVISEVLAQLPFFLPLIAALIGYFGFARSGLAPGATTRSAILPGVLHFAIQTALALAVLMLCSVALEKAGLASLATVSALALALGYWLMPYPAGLLVALYLRLSNRFLGMHGNEVFSAQAITGYKSFLRMRVDAEGLTVFPVGLTEVCSSWNDAPGVVRVGNGDTALGLFGLGKRRTYDVAHGTTHLIDPQQRLRPHLIEDPILIPRSTGTMA